MSGVCKSPRLYPPATMLASVDLVFAHLAPHKLKDTARALESKSHSGHNFIFDRNFLTN